jgi:hypothetical protein
LERVDDWRLKNLDKHQQHVLNHEASVAKNAKKQEENRMKARSIIEEQTQKETSAANRSTNGVNEDEQAKGAIGGKTPEKQREAEKPPVNKPDMTQHDQEGVEDHQKEKAVVKAIEDMTFEEFKEIKRGRGRPKNEELKRRKNSQSK